MTTSQLMPRYTRSVEAVCAERNEAASAIRELLRVGISRRNIRLLRQYAPRISSLHQRYMAEVKTKAGVQLLPFEVQKCRTVISVKDLNNDAFEKAQYILGKHGYLSEPMKQRDVRDDALAIVAGGIIGMALGTFLGGITGSILMGIAGSIVGAGMHKMLS